MNTKRYKNNMNILELSQQPEWEQAIEFSPVPSVEGGLEL